ncbi:MAG TPA: hypothetical protein VK763_03240 [Terriglobales bacterium]|jgi:hypothetical protein|nr:hypothetical protein [Terriglobales bacterium]
MKILATLLFALTLPGTRLAPPLRPSVDPLTSRQSANHGQWYLADTGHAVFCYGPVKLMKQPMGGLQRVATFCRGDRAMVPLKD